MSGKLKNILNKLRPAAADLETPILVFPVVVVLVVAATFLFPVGKCGAWQFWSALAFTLALVFAKQESFRRSFLCSGSFLLFLAAVWAITNVTITTGWFDISRYHLPAIRMMIEGWNPVWQGTFDGIEQATGMSPRWMNPYHVISMPKGVWYFCASSYYFTHDAFNLMQPLMVFLTIPVICSVFRAFRPLHIVFRILAAVIIFELLPTHDDIVDAAVGFAAIGLLLEMYNYFKHGRWSILRLVVFTFWMAVSKQTAMLHAAVFWGVFVVFNIFRRNWKVWRDVLVAGSIAFVLFAVTSASPYVSSYMNFGHPLYPRYTGDEENHPAVNITNDFFDRNDDAASMGHFGAWVNAFVSSKGARAYYKYKYSRDEFFPDAWTWHTQWMFFGSPTGKWYKFRFASAVATLLILGGVPGAFLAACFVFGTMAMPTEMIGYTRYTPWAACAFVFIILLLEKIKWKFVSYIAFAAYAWFAYETGYHKTLLKIAQSIDNSYAIKRMLKEAPPKTFLVDCTSRFSKKEDPLIANLVLTKKHVPELKDTEIVSYPYKGVDVTYARKAGYPFFYDKNCKVPFDCDLEKYSAYRRFEKKKVQPWYKLFLKTFFTTMPKSLWETIYGK